MKTTLNCGAYISFEGVSFDHRIITAKIWVSLCRNKKKTVITTHYNWSSLANRNISNKYIVTVRNKFHTHQEISERHIPNDEYEKFVTVPMKTSAECIPTEPKGKCRIPWKSLVVRKNEITSKKKKHPQ